MKTKFNTFEFKEDSISIKHAIKILKKAKKEGHTLFVPVLSKGDHDYKTEDHKDNLKLIFLK